MINNYNKAIYEKINVKVSYVWVPTGFRGFSLAAILPTPVINFLPMASNDTDPSVNIHRFLIHLQGRYMYN